MKLVDNKSRNPVFIVSTGRAGSTMLARVLAMHPAVCALHEPHPHLRTEAFNKWLTPERAKQIEKKLKKKREDLISQVRINRLVYVESSNYASHLIKELYKIFDAKFVHLYRDGRNFIRSGLERDWYKKESLQSKIKTFIRRRYLVNIGKPSLDNLLLPPSHFKTRFEKIAWLWTEINGEILRSFSSLPSERKFSLRLEGIDKEGLTALHDFIDIPVYPELLNEMLDLVYQRPNRTKTYTFPPHTEWSDWEKQRFGEIAGNMMRTLGYVV